MGIILLPISALWFLTMLMIGSTQHRVDKLEARDKAPLVSTQVPVYPVIAKTEVK